MIYDVLVESWGHVRFKRGLRLLLVELRSLTGNVIVPKSGVPFSSSPILLVYYDVLDVE